MLIRKMGVATGHLVLYGSQRVGLDLTILGITAILIGLERLGGVEIDIPWINMKAQVTETKIRITGIMTRILIKTGKHEIK